MDIAEVRQLDRPSFILQCLFRLILLRHYWKILFHLRFQVRRLQQDIRIDFVAIPIFIHPLRERLVGDQQIIANMRIDRHIFHYTRHFASFLSYIASEDQDFPDRVRSLEIFPGNTFGDNYLVRSVQTTFFISLQEFEVKEIEKVSFRIAYTCLPI